jgi:hypothetical protein
MATTRGGGLITSTSPSRTADVEQSLTNLSVEQTSSLVSAHPVLCELLQRPCQDRLIVPTRRQQSQELGVGGVGWGAKQE